LGLAEYVSTASKDPSTKVGAVIVDPDRRVVSVGYNGFPRGVEDTEERLHNRDIKYKMVVHAECNALMFSNLASLKGCAIYVWPMMPCAACASMIIQKGITTVVATQNDNPTWQHDFELSKQLFTEASVLLRLYESNAPKATSPVPS
jgi:dCMP deaminase